MADTKITALTAISTVDPAVDVLPIVDVSDTTMAASGTTKKITSNQILGAGGTATLASATITGDLTVDTSTLKVDSANNRVGIGTASPSATFDIRRNASGSAFLSYHNGGNGTVTSGADLNEIRCDDTTTSYNLLNLNVLGSARFVVASNGVCTWSNVGGVAGTAMTLNSTGLGVGIAPDSAKSTRLSVYQTGDLTDETAPLSVGNTAAGGMRLYAGVNNTNEYVYIGSVKSGTGYRSMILQPNGGNVGVGVTPSARFHSKAGAVTLGGIIETGGANALLSFADSATSSYTRVQIGSSGNNLVALINGSTALTLNSSNSLVLGSAAIATTATDGFLYIPGCAGTPTGTPTAQTGRVPLVVDTTNNKLYFYSGGSWVAAN